MLRLITALTVLTACDVTPDVRPDAADLPTCATACDEDEDGEPECWSCDGAGSCVCSPGCETEPLDCVMP